MLMDDSSLPPMVAATIAFIFGLLVGSFLNVVIHRVPLGRSVVSPRSSCPSCATPIAPWDNIPLVSFFLLRGRCRHCAARISWAYPAIELLTGLLFVAVITVNGAASARIALAWFVAVMLCLGAIDARHQLLPDRIIYPAIVLATAGAIFRSPVFAELDLFPVSQEFAFSRVRTALIGAAIVLLASTAAWLVDQLDVLLFGKYFDWIDEPGAESALAEEKVYGATVRLTLIVGVVLALSWIVLVTVDGPRDPGLYLLASDRLINAAIGAFAGAAVLWVVRAAYFYLRGVEGMGLGDIKLMFVIGAFLGWVGAIMVLLVASVLGLILGVTLARQKDTGLKTRLPLGTCLALAAIVVAFMLDLGISIGF